MTAACGGLNVFRFLQNGKIIAEPVTIPESRIKEIQNRLLLIYTETSRVVTNIAVDVLANLDSKKDIL